MGGSALFLMFSTIPQYRVLDINSPDDLDYTNLEIVPRLASLDIPTLSILNLGAGNGTGILAGHIQELPVKQITNVELFEDALWLLAHYPHAAPIVEHVNEGMLEFCRMQRDQSYDVCLICDALEHLTRDEGFELLDHLKRIVRKRTLIWIPFGETPQGEYGGNAHQEHRSTWTPHDFAKLYTGKENTPKVQVDVVWRHFHIEGNPRAGWVTISYK